MTDFPSIEVYSTVPIKPRVTHEAHPDHRDRAACNFALREYALRLAEPGASTCTRAPCRDLRVRRQLAAQRIVNAAPRGPHE